MEKQKNAASNLKLQVESYPVERVLHALQGEAELRRKISPKQSQSPKHTRNDGK